MTNPTGPLARTVLAAQSDERLVRLLREGHEPAFDEIVRRYRGPLVAFATAIVNATRAEDVVQTALEKAHRALCADEREISLRPWLFTIVRNGSLNLIRAEPVTDELDPWLSPAAESEGPEQVAERREEMDRLFTAICALPIAQREALVRRELEGIGHGEIAAELGTTSTAVRGLIFRARTQLRNAMGAMVPFHLLRSLVAEGSAVGVAGGGASAALLGGAGAKGGAAVAAAVLALGAGIAVERQNGNGHGDGDVAVAEASGGTPDAAGGSSRQASGTPAAGAGDDAARPAAGSGEHGDGGDQGEDGNQGSSADGPGGATGVGNDIGGGGDGAHSSSGSGHPGSGGSGYDGGGENHSGSSGPGGGHSGPGGGDDDPEPSGGDDGDHSGPGGGDSHGSGDEVGDAEPPEAEIESDDDSSGPGDGSDHSDHEGPRSGDSGPDRD